MEITQTANNVLSLKIDVPVGYEQWFLLTSDRHFDSVSCKRGLMFEHLDEAVRRNAYVIDAGDFFSMMEGRYDPRRSFENMRPEYVGRDYLGAIVDDAVEKMTPYADRFLVLGKGNHDMSVRKNCGIDVMKLLVDKLNDKGGNIQLGGYSGWVRFQFNVEGVRIRKQLWYYHGSGGGGEVTRGVIRSNRMAVVVQDADVVLTGHTHDMWDVPIKRIKLNNKGRPKQEIARFLNVGSYSDEYGTGEEDSWWLVSGKSPRPQGAAWLRFYRPGNKQGISYDVVLDPH